MRARASARLLLVTLLASAGCAGPQKIVFRANADGSPTPPVILDPKPDAVIVDVRPPITLALPPGTDSAHVEVCEDQACKAVRTAFDTALRTTPTPIDLTSGIYWIRAGARIGTRQGKPGPTQRLAVELRTQVRRGHVSIDGPKDSAAALADLAVFAEKALAFYVDYLGLRQPDAEFHLSYFATDDGYRAMAQALDAAELADHGGFTRGMRSYMRWPAPIARVSADGAGTIERVTAHELVHQVQHLAGRWMNARMAPWLIEGSADLLTELVIARVYGLAEPRLVSSFGRYAAAVKARKEGYAIPVKQFFEADREGWQAHGRATNGLFYSQGYALLRSLASPPERMRAFLRDLWSWGADVDLHLDRNLRKRFGALEVIQRTFDSWLDATAPSPYDENGLDLRLQSDDRWHLQTLRGKEGSLVFNQKHPAAATVELDADFDPDAQRVTLLFGVGERRHRLRIKRDGVVELVVSKDATQMCWIQPLRGRHRVRLALTPTSVAAFIDDVECLRADVSYRGGKLGVVVLDGWLLIHSLRASPAPEGDQAAP